MSKLSKDEIERWITLENGVHVPIKKSETEADVKKRLDGWNNQGNKKINYHKYKDNKEEMTKQFKMNNSILVNKDVVETLDYEVLADVYETIEDIKSSYNAHVSVIKLFEEDDDSTAMAQIDMAGVLQLNQEYFDSDWYLNDVYNDCVKDKFHPPAPNGAIGVVAHELGHAIVHQKLYDMEKKYVAREKAKPSNEPSDSRIAISEDMKHVDNWLAGKTNSLMMKSQSGSDMLNEWMKSFQKATDAINSNKEVQEQWGGKSSPKKPNLSLIGLATRFPRPIGVSGYAEKSYHELIAEAFEDVYCNGSEASLVSKEVYKQIIKEMEK